MSKNNNDNPEFQEKQTTKIGDGELRSQEELLKEVEILTQRLESIEASKKAAIDRKVWTGKKIGSFFIGKGLKESLTNLYKELPNNVTKETLADVTTNVIWRFTRIGFFAFFVALIPYFLLYQQNGLLEQQNYRIDKQNELFAYQNKKVEIQTELLEADRRSALIFLMSNIMDKMDSELKDDWNGDGVRNLSPELIGRIAALSYSFKPYRFLDGDTLITKALSPERGQLLVNLVNSGLASNFNIYDACFFRDADLRGAILYKADLMGVELDGSNLSNANMSGAYLMSSFLGYANLSGCNLEDGNLSGAQMEGADLNRANLTRAYLEAVYLGGADLSGADLNGAYLGEADLNGANLNGAYLGDADLSGSNLNGANLDGVYLSGSDLTGAYVLNDDSTKTYLIDSSLKEDIYYQTWLSNLGDLEVEGAAQIQQDYIVTKDKKGRHVLRKK